MATHEDVEELRQALIGRSVVAVKMDSTRGVVEKWEPPVAGEVYLDNGRVLLLAGHEGGCACSSGDYELTRLNDMPINGITNVEVAVDYHDEWGDEASYRIFVIAQDGRFELARFDGSDGNGYYGTGFWFTVSA